MPGRIIGRMTLTHWPLSGLRLRTPRLEMRLPTLAELDQLASLAAETRAANWELDAIDRSDEGLADYSGPVVSDFDFNAYSHSALVRMADEVCLQMHLLYLSFAIAVRARAGSDVKLADSICTRGLTGVAGLGAERIHRALSLPGGIPGVLKVFELHPLFNPVGYVDV